VNHLINERRDGWLIEGLKASGYDDKQSPSIGKAFGRFKTQLGFGPELVFHSLRHTLQTKLHETDCPPLLASKVVGHKIPGLTFGHYSHAELKGQMQEALERVSYPI
jgi:integrase